MVDSEVSNALPQQGIEQKRNLRKTEVLLHDHEFKSDDYEAMNMEVQYHFAHI